MYWLLNLLFCVYDRADAEGAGEQGGAGRGADEEAGRGAEGGQDSGRGGGQGTEDGLLTRIFGNSSDLALEITAFLTNCISITLFNMLLIKHIL